jgi:transketolase
VACPLLIDEDALAAAVKSGTIVTYEDHHARTGLGCSIGMRLAEMGEGVRFKAMGVTRYGDSGASDEVVSRMGLSSDDLAMTFSNLLRS